MLAKLFQAVATNVQETQYEPPKCPCCGRNDVIYSYQSNDKVSVFASTTGMAPLGFAVPFFFRYIKIIIQSLAVVFLVYSIYKMYAQSSTNYCEYGKTTPQKSSCGQVWKFYFSLANRNPNEGVDWIEKGLFITSFVIMVAIRAFYQYRFRTLDQKLDKENIDITDYTVMVYNLPLNTQEARLEHFFKTHFKDPVTEKYLDVKVDSINFLYQDFDDTLEMGENLKKLLDKYRHDFDSKDEEEIEEMKERFRLDLEVLEKHLDRHYDKANIRAEVKSRFTGVALVTLENEEHADIIKDSYVLKGFARTVYHLLGYMPKPILKCLSNKVKHEFRSDCYIFLDVPKPPEDIIWQNVGRGKMNRLTRKFLGLICAGLILGATLLTLLGLKYWQLRQGAVIWISILFTVLMKIVNGVAMYFNRKIIEIERINSFTMLNTEIVWRTTLVTTAYRDDFFEHNFAVSTFEFDHIG